MSNVYLKDKTEALLEERARRYADELQDPNDLNELLRLIIIDADRARRLEQELGEAFRESVTREQRQRWSEP